MSVVEIGSNAVVGAGSIVTKDVKPKTVVAGTPLREICALEEYSLKSEKSCFNYNHENYRRNKLDELIKVFSNDMKNHT